MSDDQRVKELEMELARTKARLRAAGLEPPSADLPDVSQADELLALAEQWPKLRPTDQEPQHRLHFRNAVRYLCYVRRTGDLNSTYSLSFFLDGANAWLRQYQVQGGTSLRAFAAAALVSGIKTSRFDRFPYDVEVGIGLGTAAKPSNGWRSILTAGKLPEALALRRPLPPEQRQLVRRAGDDQALRQRYP
jgi:hypothetical protein